MFNFAERRAKVGAAMREAGIDAIFCPIGGDLEYLTGTPRRLASFGNYDQTHQWALGAFISSEGQCTFLVPQGYSAFNLSLDGFDGEVIRIAYEDDSTAIFTRVLRRFGSQPTIGVSERTWGETVLQLLSNGSKPVEAGALINRFRRIKSADELDAMTQAAAIADEVLGEITNKVAVGVTELELASEVDYLLRARGSRTPSFDTGVWSMGRQGDRDATKRLSTMPLRPEVGVSFDFGAVVDGYCSDFGRTIFVGDPDQEYQHFYDVLIAAQAAGIAAATPGNRACDIHNATAAVIRDAGYGEWFRHRTGHCIGLDMHERPFISVEDQTVLEPGMTFTIEPSIFWPGHVGVRIEDVFVCGDATGARSLNTFPRASVAV